MKKIMVLMAITILIAIHNISFARDIKIPITTERLPFAVDLVKKLVLSETKYSLSQPYKKLGHVEHSRVINDMRNKKIDLFLSITNKDYEQEFHAIKIPVYRGLLGMRIAIIKKSNKHLFKHVKNIHDLKQFKAGQGRYWSDTAILQHNNLPTITEVRYNNLFTMLNAGRFDYFPRGINELWREIEDKKALNLVVDEHLLLWYQAPMYIFLHKNDIELINHIEKEFIYLVDSGEFKNMFYKNKSIRLALANSQLSSRTIIRLDVPHSVSNTQIDHKDVWISPDELLKFSKPYSKID